LLYFTFLAHLTQGRTIVITLHSLPVVVVSILILSISSETTGSIGIMLCRNDLCEILLKKSLFCLDLAKKYGRHGDFLIRLIKGNKNIEL
jgi:hypothetical protein